MVESGEAVDDTDDGTRFRNSDVDESEVSYSETEGRGEAVEVVVDVDLSERCEGEYGHCLCIATCGADADCKEPCAGFDNLADWRR